MKPQNQNNKIRVVILGSGFSEYQEYRHILYKELINKGYKVDVFSYDKSASALVAREQPIEYLPGNKQYKSEYLYGWNKDVISYGDLRAKFNKKFNIQSEGDLSVVPGTFISCCSYAHIVDYNEEEQRITLLDGDSWFGKLSASEIADAIPEAKVTKDPRTNSITITPLKLTGNVFCDVGRINW